MHQTGTLLLAMNREVGVLNFLRQVVYDSRFAFQKYPPKLQNAMMRNIEPFLHILKALGAHINLNLVLPYIF